MDLKEYIRLLKRTGEILKTERDQELRVGGHPGVAIESLSESFDYSIRTKGPSPTSGLVELQYYLMKQRS